MRPALAVVGITLAIYVMTADAPFVYENRNWVNVVGPEHDFAWEPFSHGSQWPNRWLTHWTYQFQAVDGTAEPRRYHLVNVLLHLLCGGLVGLLAWRQNVPKLGAWIAAAVFLWHPLNTQAVAYVSARSDLLMTLCTVIAVIAVLMMRWWALPFVLAGCVFAGTSKELGALSVLMVLLARWPRVVLQLVPLALLIALNVAWAEYGVRWPQFETWWELASANAVGLWRVIGLVLVPVGLSIDPDPWSTPMVLRMVALWAIPFAAVWIYRTRTPLEQWAALSVAVALLPRVVMPTLEPIHDQHAYLAMVPISQVIGEKAGTLCAQWL